MNKMEVALNLFDEHSFIRVSKLLIQYTKDTLSVVVLCEIISKMRRFQKDLYKGEWLFYTRDNIEKDFFLSHYQQRVIFQNLEELDLIKTMTLNDTQVRRKYYTVNFEKLLEVFSQNQEIQ